MLPTPDRPRHSAGVRCRPAGLDDAGAIAGLHADSWQRHYRGAFLDSYLDGDVLSDRRAVWRHRLAHPEESQSTLVAERAGDIIGFVHTEFDEDPRWGSLLDNLHVQCEQKRAGTGTRLLSAAALDLLEQRPSSALHLWVLDQNEAAQAFYLARGGERVETELRGPFPGGGRAIGHRYVWPDPSVLITALT